MNTKRIVFWAIFVILLALIVWGVVASLNKDSSNPKVGTPAPVATTDHVRGPANATVTLTEYSDFQCPACEAYFPLVEHVFASSTVPVRMAYRHFPLPQHPNAKIAAQASEAASLQGKFWDMYTMLFSNHTQWTELADPHSVFIGYAQRIGLNVSKFTSDIDSQPVKDAVEASLNASQELGLYQTPTFFLNGKMITNPQSYDEFISDIQAAAR